MEKNRKPQSENARNRAIQERAFPVVLFQRAFHTQEKCQQKIMKKYEKYEQ